jgi:hypothetical protein
VGLIGDYGANRVPRIAKNAAGVFEVLPRSRWCIPPHYQDRT